MKYLRILVIYTSALLITSCNNNDGPKIVVENEINAFVWGGLNSWYFWNAEVEKLGNNNFKSNSQRNAYINQFPGPSELFEALRHPSDRFSWIVDDYNELDNALQGISTSFGYEYGLVRYNDTQLIGYVQYVLENSPAELVGLERGDIFYAVDGTELTESNYRDLLRTENYRLSIGTIDVDRIEHIRETDELIAIQIEENPVHIARVIDFEGTKVGYLCYNQFVHTFHSELNSAFGIFKNEGISELVIDLRYNPGGSVYTTMTLASMIYQQADASNIFAKILYNANHEDLNVNLPFLEEVDILDGGYNILSKEVMNELDLSRLYVITSRGTASASELLIAGLRAYMDVKVIGLQTVGKNEGSITLYDAPASDYRSKNGANPNHTWAMQPIVSKLADSNSFSDYSEGLLPDIEISEVSYLLEMKALGDPEEILLKTALEDIAGISALGRRPPEDPNDLIYLSKKLGNYPALMHINGLGL